ncbi:alpha/beta hydrolase family protein [Rhodococcus sp. P-2]|uniref:alpha/beta hydrolase family protein n=1 Tax=Rhodococcus sp. P-2 TaxID=2795031 RepID=UPI001F427025|nr:lipase family protein [Rhodococcus sp. P-2]
MESYSELSAAVFPLGTGAAQRVVYRTLRTADRWGDSSGSVFLPEGEPPAGGWPVISYAHGTLGSADQCAPSSTGFGPGEIEPIERWLREGYAVVATDYSGLGTDGVLAYLDGHAAGANAVDIVRAAHELYGNVLSPRWMVAGLSEGGHAAYFAGHEASSRAPELDFRGSVVVAGPTHMEGLFPLAGRCFPISASRDWWDTRCMSWLGSTTSGPRRTFARFSRHWESSGWKRLEACAPEISADRFELSESS